MKPDPQSPGGRSRRPLLRRADQLAIAVLVGASLVAMAGYFIAQHQRAGGLIDIDHAAPLLAKFRVDINSATWPELSQLPEIGETLARRIVEVRSSGGPFLSPEDLERRVPGIGPRTLEKIQPYLRAPSENAGMTMPMKAMP